MASRGVPEARPASRRARVLLAIRTIRVSYFSAYRALARVDPRQVDGARQRALQLLDDVAIRIDPEVDSELTDVLEATRGAIRSGRLKR